jgi:hypothetical protein
MLGLGYQMLFFVILYFVHIQASCNSYKYGVLVQQNLDTEQSITSYVDCLFFLCISFSWEC